VICVSGIRRTNSRLLASEVIEELLPRQVAAVEAFGDDPAVALFAEESAVVARAVEKRRREFGTVRACARSALARLGLPPVSIVPGPRGAPQWPDGVVGSMTHCAGYRAAAVAHAADVLTVGVDAEPHEPLPQGVLDLIALAAEKDGISGLTAAAPGTCWDRLLFSAKESVYKAWFPLTGRWLDFSDAMITVDLLEGTFTARLLVRGPEVGGRVLDRFCGRWLARDGLIITAIAEEPNGRG
jgi:4'-phosphopantetheinyl transferase EntD